MSIVKYKSPIDWNSFALTMKEIGVIEYVEGYQILVLFFFEVHL